jgi:plastocyanin
MRIPRPLVLAATGVTLVGAACGDDDTTADTGAAARKVEIEMVDIAFEPDTLEVARGR